MKPTLALRHSQRLSLTPELRQALGLLQLSAVELATKVQEALEGNVLLERGDEEEEAPRPQDLDGAPLAPAGAAEAPVVDAGMDWDAAPAGPGWDDEDMRPEAADRGGQSLREYLLWQLELARLSARDAAIGAAIIDSLNDDGYLTEALEDLRLSLTDSDAAPEADEMEAVLHRVQAFDPPGVAARDLKECLLLQLRQLPEGPVRTLAVKLASQHLEDLAAREHQRLCKTLGVERGQLDAALALILGLHPRPGTAVAGAPVDYVIPDVLVRRRDGAWQVELNPAAVPRVRVNAGYAAALRRRGDSGGDLAQQLQEARWLVRSIRMRNDTLMRVATSIVRKQRAFLEQGDEAMQPLLMKDLAVELELHESTVSRVVANKHMVTPRGTLAFRHFFSGELPADAGNGFSATAIRAMIKKLVAQEDPRAPLSDNHITQQLVSRGVHVARRTVAKYRESMTIPPAHERRRADGR